MYNVRLAHNIAIPTGTYLLHIIIIYITYDRATPDLSEYSCRVL